MGQGARIGHLNMCKGLDLLELGAEASIGRLNWISGFPSTDKSHFSGETRDPSLLLAEHSAITNRHIIDCTDSITVGAFTTVAGFRSQFLTHSIDLELNSQRAKPITIGKYCFVGTGVIVLGGSTLPDNCILGAGSVLAKHYTEEATLYAGAPARPVKKINVSGGYFIRSTGFVD